MKQRNIRKPFFYLVALGCPKNLVDAEIISGSLMKQGYTLSFDPDDADIYVINTCAFLPAARNEAADEIEIATEWKKAVPGRKIAVCGCLSEYDKERCEFSKRFPEVDLWSQVNDIERLGELLEGASSDGGAPSYLNSDLSPRLQLTLPHLAYLKVADGCNNRCTYCAIPKLRGKLRTRPLESVVQEAELLVSGGVKELIVVAQDTTAYGMDRPESGENLSALIKRLDKIDGEFFVRLLYTHPAHYTDELIETLASSSKFLPYLDIPLQHISDKILKSMNRHVTKRQIEELIVKLRAAIPDLTLRTTFITGFPGEGEAEFAELCDFVRRSKFERMGVFPYSAEISTAAAKFDNQVSTDTAEERASTLMRRQVERMKRRNKRLLGREGIVIVDNIENDIAVARGSMDAPDIDNVVLIPAGRRVREGEFVKVRYVGTSGCDLVAEVASNRKKK